MYKEAIVDSDDLADILPDRNCMPFLLKFKERWPNFKVTLWTIPQQSSEKFLSDVSGLDWVELGVHGLKHEHNYEFAKVTRNEAMSMLYYAYFKRPDYFKKMFKAPGWQISDGTYQALVDAEFGIMDQAYNNERRPKELPVYVYSDDGRDERLIHTHTWDCCDNWIEKVLLEEEKKFTKDTKFKFISEEIWSE